MDGVTILNAWTEVHVTNWIGGLLAVISFSFAIAVLIVCVIGGLIRGEWDNVGLGLGAIIILVIFTLFSFSIIGQPKRVTIYEVTISDDVSFNKFMERYTIISQRGNIYKVEDKNNA